MLTNVLKPTFTIQNASPPRLSNHANNSCRHIFSNFRLLKVSFRNLRLKVYSVVSPWPNLRLKIHCRHIFLNSPNETPTPKFTTETSKRAFNEKVSDRNCGTPEPQLFEPCRHKTRVLLFKMKVFLDFQIMPLIPADTISSIPLMKVPANLTTEKSEVQTTSVC